MPGTGSGLWLCGRVWTDGWRPQLVPQVCEGILNTHGHEQKPNDAEWRVELHSHDSVADGQRPWLSLLCPFVRPSIRLRVSGYQRFDEPVSKMTLNSCGGGPTEMGP